VGDKVRFAKLLSDSGLLKVGGVAKAIKNISRQDYDGETPPKNKQKESSQKVPQTGKTQPKDTNTKEK